MQPPDCTPLGRADDEVTDAVAEQTGAGPDRGVSVNMLWPPVEPKTGGWTFLTHHARVLLVIARAPDLHLHDIAAACDITERTAQSIVTDLEQANLQ
ncbi:MarR family transcriptional regulator [Streptomyces sp. NPDC059680]|uniref:MarR family transcriptional regulator n=1 Tax=Streptomyces sp. NPDC059680 TaxID=3346904 RepID=UPI003686006E